jgi:predicted Zn-dependent protease
MRGFRSSLWVLFFLLSLLQKLGAEQNCPLPPSIQPVAPGKNIFSDQQEIDLGDVMAESFAQEIPLVDDESLNEHLQEIGDRRSVILLPVKFASV